MSNKRIKDMDRVDMPREKLAKYGMQKMSDHELFAIILGSGIKGMNVVQMSKRITALVSSGKTEEIKHIPGLGTVKYAQIQAVFELGRRMNTKHTIEICTPEHVWNACADFRNSKKEHVVAFYLDTHSRLIERRIISIGTLDSSLVHPREVFEPAIALSAASIIIAHNHPSGNIESSSEDREVTTRLREAGKILGIPLIDHIIVSAHEYRSCM